jgi:glycosyltransferase involved in cell wall biosynthesis
MPLVSFITRTKNRNILLKRAIQSVFDQTIKDFEMIIVNDGGDKKALESEIDSMTGIDRSKIKVIHNPTSVGMEAASNIGIKSSDSKYLLIHDDDDSLHPIFLAEMLALLEKDEKKKGAICWSIRIIEKVLPNSKIEIVSKESFNNWLQGITIPRLLCDNSFPPISFLYKREVIKTVGLYDENLPVLGDWDFNVRFILNHDIYLVKKELAYYHHRTNLQSGDLSNSVIGGDAVHKEYQILLRNKWLREELISNKMGVGVVSALLKSIDGINDNVNYTRDNINQSIYNRNDIKIIEKEKYIDREFNVHTDGYDHLSLINHFKYKIKKRLGL